jgi:hypothetical protein
MMERNDDDTASACWFFADWRYTSLMDTRNDAGGKRVPLRRKNRTPPCDCGGALLQAGSWRQPTIMTITFNHETAVGRYLRNLA